MRATMEESKGEGEFSWCRLREKEDDANSRVTCDI